MKTKILILVLSMLFPQLWAQKTLFPTPAAYQSKKGTFILSNKTAIESRGDDTRKMADMLKSEIQPLYDTENPVSNTITLHLDPSLKLPDEGYRLSITTESAMLQASTPTGLFYATQSFLQLARAGNGTLSACEINDAPRYAWRGFMLDESRHFFGKEKVKQYLDIMSTLRMNVFHWHLTDEQGWRIEIKRYPRLTTVGAIGNWHDPNAPARYYTQEDIKEIVAYATERHITIIPEFDMPGHASAAGRAYPEISGGGTGRWQHFTYHPCKEETYLFINNVLDEIISLFPSPYIHIGGDEVHYGNQDWFTDPRIQQFIRDNDLKNELGLEHYFIRRVADMLQAKGKTMIGWDEIADSGVSPSQAIVMWWRHDKPSQLVNALEKGFRVIMTPRRPMYGDFVQYGRHTTGRTWNGYNPIEYVYQFPDPVIHLTKNFEQQIIGLQMTMWTERIADPKRLDFMTFPRLVAVAESAWTPAKSKECSLFMQKLPTFLKYLDSLGIYYFNPFAPEQHAEPGAPEKEDVIQNG